MKESQNRKKKSWVLRALHLHRKWKGHRVRARLPQDLRGFGDMFCPPLLKILRMVFFEGELVVVVVVVVGWG